MYIHKDAYYKKAKEEGYKSRAAYKLIELNKKFNIIKKGNRVLDCGAAPGGWSQVALSLVGANGFVLACDLEKIEGIKAPNFTFIHGNMLEEQIIKELTAFSPEGFNVVLSDMAPKTSGIKVKDHAESLELATVALDTARKTLKEGGSFLVKLFDGEDRPAYVKAVEKYFRKVKMLRPDATRKASFEVYIFACGFLGQKAL